VSAGASLGYSLEFPEYTYSGEADKKTLYQDGYDNWPKNAINHIEMSKDIILDNYLDYLDMAAVISTIDSTEPKNVSTSASFAWTFDIFHYDEFTPDDSQTDFGLSLGYLVNVN
jgi:hypothetical protein